MSINKLLEERQKTHGDFITHARISQGLKIVVRQAPKWNYLSEVKKESLDMILHKIARILNGDPNFPDHWEDVAGYATLGKSNDEDK